MKTCQQICIREMLILYYWCIIVQGLFSLSSIQNRNRTFICPYSLYLTLLLQYTRRNICDITFFCKSSCAERKKWANYKARGAKKRLKKLSRFQLACRLPLESLKFSTLFHTQRILFFDQEFAQIFS